MEKFDFGRYPEQFFCLIIDGGKFKMQPTFMGESENHRQDFFLVFVSKRT